MSAVRVLRLAPELVEKVSVARGFTWVENVEGGSRTQDWASVEVSPTEAFAALVDRCVGCCAGADADAPVALLSELLGALGVDAPVRLEGESP